MAFSFDIFQIYRQYCDITSRVYDSAGGSYQQEEESQKARISRDALAHLFKEVESKISSESVSILEEVYKLMLRLNLTADYSEFSRFYGFVFFICRENGQKSISVSRAIMAWRLVLEGRFRLLNQWCNFVETNQRHNISEDTWRQVLAFSRSVHENLEGYDPEGAWPVLIDEFAEHMYRISGPRDTPNILCDCGDLESQQSDDTLSGLKSLPGSKRKSFGDSETGQESSNRLTNSHSNANSKRSRLSFDWRQNLPNEDDCKQISSTKSQCAVEGCLSKGFAGLLSGHSCSQFDQDRRVSYT